VQLGAARIASDLLEVTPQVFEEYCNVQKLNEEEDRKLKDENPFGWKIHVEAVRDENYPDEEDTTAAGASAGAVAAGAAGGAAAAGASDGATGAAEGTSASGTAAAGAAAAM
jgi:hypothetical protein